MKTILSLLAFLFFVKVATCQPPEDGTINYRPMLDKYIGTWKGNDTSGGELTIKLKKVMYNQGRYKEEVLLGTRKYIKNGQVIEDQTAMFHNLVDTMREPPIVITRGMPTGEDTTYLRGYFWDFLKHRTDILELDFIGGSPSSMQWHLSNRQGSYVRLPGAPPHDSIITLPTEMILTRQP